MITLLIRLGVFLATAAAGLLLAGLLVNGVTLTVSGFLLSVVIFAALQSLVAPLSEKLLTRFAPALTGGVGIISTFLSLLLATLLPGGLQISGITAWLLGTLVVWIVTAIGAAVLHTIVTRRGERKRAKKVLGRS